MEKKISWWVFLVLGVAGCGRVRSYTIRDRIGWRRTLGLQR
jgi:hypothetical protein